MNIGASFEQLALLSVDPISDLGQDWLGQTEKIFEVPPY